jgi:hypothetical protein
MAPTDAESVGPAHMSADQLIATNAHQQGRRGRSRMNPKTAPSPPGFKPVVVRESSGRFPGRIECAHFSETSPRTFAAAELSRLDAPFVSQ